jgi:type I restriction enzyme S subunit
MTFDANVKKLGDFMRLDSGFPFKSSEWVETGIPVIKIRNVQDGFVDLSNCSFVNEITAKKAKDWNGQIGNTLIALTGAGVGEIGRIQENQTGLINQRVGWVRPKIKEDEDYIYYLLRFLKNQIIELASGSAQPNVSPRDILNIPIKVPDKSERRAIGSLLNILDKKLELNKGISKTLEDIAQTIFKSWFIDFDPVKAKMNGEKPIGMDDETAALFPDSFEESELGLIPKGWEVKCASELFEVGIGRTPPRKEPEWFCGGSDGVPWVSIRDMGTFETYSHDTNEALTLDAVTKFKVPLVPENTVLMSFKLTVGKLCITDRDLVTNEAIAHFRITDKSPIETFYTYLWLSNIEMGNLDSTSSIGTATNSGVIKQIKFLVPTKRLLDSFLNTVNPVFHELKALRRQSSNLIQIRDSLLPRLISGELQIPEEMLAS